MQINRILVPVDFSPPSTLAVNCGIALARKLKAKISLLHVVESPRALLYTFPKEAEKVEAQRKEQADKMLPVLVAPEDQDDLDVHFIVRTGEVEEVVESVLAEEHADAVVMGTHGRGLFGRLFIGSTTQALLRKLGVPVLTVCQVNRPLEFHRILFASDLAFDSERGFEFALEMARTTGASLVVAHVRNEPPLTYETPEVAMMLEEERKRTRKLTHDKFEGFRARGNAAKVPIECVLRKGEASENIIQMADANEADLIILGLRKRGAVDRAVFGSTAEPVIRGARVPVLSVPIDAALAPKQHRDRIGNTLMEVI
jgi:nucleotide-binding universal stress UspA family protein